MNWSEVRHSYPNQWLVVEALQAHTTPPARPMSPKRSFVRPEAPSASLRIETGAESERQIAFLEKLDWG